MNRFLCKSVVLLLIAATASVAAAYDTAMFNYQGRVLVQGIPYTGTGQMKVAILATSGTTPLSLWSNDGKSLDGSQPQGSFEVPVAGGVFDAMIGESSLGMQTLPAILFNRNDALLVRVWFNDGVHGFQQLIPDRPLTHPRSMGVDDLHSSTTLYVNGETGNDLNSGLSPAQAKKTIQSAVDMIPGSLDGDLTIRIAPGIYRESVEMTGVSAPTNHPCVLLGDETTVPTDSVSPSVRVTGCDNDASHAKVRMSGFSFAGCNNVEIRGLLIDYYNEFPAYLRQSQVRFARCKASYSDTGYFADGSVLHMNNSWASHNSHGVVAYTNSQINLLNSACNDNSVYGLLAQGSCTVNLQAPNHFDRNQQGIGMEHSYLWFQAGSHYFTNNSVCAIALRYQSSSRAISSAVYSGNTANAVTASGCLAE